jgi:hypothetical protein
MLRMYSDQVSDFEGSGSMGERLIQARQCCAGMQQRRLC